MLEVIGAQITKRAMAGVLVLCLGVIALCQTPASAPAGAPTGPRGVLRLRMTLKGKDPKLKLQRKRFYLIKGSLEQNKTLLASQMERNKALLPEVISRKCYYEKIRATPQLIAWLKDFDCESVYCREVEPKFVEEGPNVIREFKDAVDIAARDNELGNRELARKWIAAYMKEELRSGFYELQQKEIRPFITQAEKRAKEIDPNSDFKVISVMTEGNGNAYFTDLTPGTYVITNVIPTEVGDFAEVWTSEVTVTEGDLISVQSSEKVFTISNDQSKLPKAIQDNKQKVKNQTSVEVPLPACSTANK
ncbi:MAG TPA: carboxypeptidase-like regulatory domain-containing protein [Pyrinomonadaceae bacterium]|nr:carboxypeptidase-like regulatory domain-containing protein [Pyrinomonadaceae bacterium]